MKYYIYIFRHGETYFNKNHIFTGLKDSVLTNKGIEQSKIIARKLKNKTIGIAIQTSLSRSRNSLKKVLKFHPECSKIITDDRIIERGYGKLEGLHHDTIIRKYGQKKFNLWHRGFNKKPPGGESFRDVEKRVGDFIVDLKKLVKKEKKNILVSAHGNSIRLFRKIMEKQPKRKVVKWFIPYDKVFVYSIDV